jgi:hypothetical protein
VSLVVLVPLVDPFLLVPLVTLGHLEVQQPLDLLEVQQPLELLEHPEVLRLRYGQWLQRHFENLVDPRDLLLRFLLWLLELLATLEHLEVL